MTKRDYRSHSMMRNTTSCKRILYKPGPTLQTSAGKLITLQIIFQILYCHKYKHERLKKPINFLNETNSTYLICQKRRKNHIKSLNRRSEVEFNWEIQQTGKPQESTSYHNIRQLIRYHLFGVRFPRVLSRDFPLDFWCKQTANIRTFGSQTTTHLQITSRYFKFPLLYNSKCQSRRIRATSTPWIWLNYAGTLSFRKRIFENFANGNRLCSRKIGFAGGSKLRKRWNQWCREFNNSRQANSQSIFSEDREQL